MCADFDINKKEDYSEFINEDYGDLSKLHLLEQYKLYVEMADRVSQRRSSVNRFFLSVNTLLMPIIGILFSTVNEIGLMSKIWSIFSSLTGIIFSFSWWSLVKSYRQLNSEKFKVIHLMQKKLHILMFDLE